MEAFFGSKTYSTFVELNFSCLKASLSSRILCSAFSYMNSSKFAEVSFG
jgi:hypothetical protein